MMFELIFSMKKIQNELVSFFEQVAQRDERLLKLLKKEKLFSLENKLWDFTLPDLYIFFQQQNDTLNNIDYKQFRKLIFNSPINQVIKQYGAEITIGNNRTKVDNSTYTLIWWDSP
jgi:hypothetical protein